MLFKSGGFFFFTIIFDRNRKKNKETEGKYMMIKMWRKGRKKVKSSTAWT